MKKLLCLLLALVMVLSLAACSESDSGSKRDKKDKDKEEVVELEDGIVGTWTVDITFTEEMLGLEGMSMEGIPVSFTFNEDDEVTLSFSDDAVEIVEEQMPDLMVEYLYAQMESEGMSREDADAMFEEYYGSSIVDYVKTSLEGEDFSSMFDGVEDTFDYEVDGDKLTIDGYEMTAEIKGDKLTITEDEDEFWGDVGLELPVVLERD